VFSVQFWLFSSKLEWWCIFLSVKMCNICLVSCWIHPPNIGTWGGKHVWEISTWQNVR
jgi:hypothetical protein